MARKKTVKKKTARKATTRAVVPKKDGAVAVINMEADAGAGMEQMGSADLAIPFLVMLQPMSPQVLKGDPMQVPGAEAGNIADTVAGKAFEQVNVVPCCFKRKLNEWVPRDEGGGLVATHPWTAEMADKYRDRDARTESGHQIVDTIEWYVLYENEEGEWNPAVLAMSSTQLSVARKWNSRIKAVRMAGKNGPFNPPSFAHQFVLSSVKRTNDSGTWYLFNVEGPESVEPDVYLVARDFHASVMEGNVRVQEDTGQTEAGEDIPF